MDVDIETVRYLCEKQNDLYVYVQAGTKLEIQ